MAGCSDDIAAWLDKLGLSEYTEKFLAAGYSSLQQCVLLSKADFSAIGIGKVDHINWLFRDLQKLKATGEIKNPLPSRSLPFSPQPSSVVNPITAPVVPPRLAIPCKPKSDESIKTKKSNEVSSEDAVKESVETKENYATDSSVAPNKKNRYPELMTVEELLRSLSKGTSGIQNTKWVTDPYYAVIPKGDVELAKSKIDFIGDKMTDHSFQVDNPLARPILKSPEMFQFLEKLHSDFDVSLSIQLPPVVLSSAVNESGVVVQVCEGDIAFEDCDTFINFTDENLILSDDVHAMLDRAELSRYEDYVKHHTPQICGTAVCFGKGVVIHAVLPEWIDGGSGEGHVISNAITESLDQAVKYKPVSIALPLLSCVDEHIPVDVLAKSCLYAVHQFIRSLRDSKCIKKIRLVLPVTMAKAFQDEFNQGVFRQFVTDGLDSTGVDQFCNLGQPGDSAWLWQDDDGEYNYYRPEDNDKLKSCVLCTYGNSIRAFCRLKIGHSNYKVSYSDMTQINTVTQKVRKVVRLPLNAFWQFKKPGEKWQQFTPQVSLMIEAMYVTGTSWSLMIDGQTHKYDFEHMIQWNVDTEEKVIIRRDSCLVYNAHSAATITISGLTRDVYRAKEGFRQYIKDLITEQSIDVQKRFIPAVSRNKKHIEIRHEVEIKPSDITQPFGLTGKFIIKGYTGSIQKAVFEIYQSIATIQRPMEWEPQCRPIELKEVLKGSPEWSKVCAHMLMTMNCHVLSIKRVQNEFLWGKYAQHKELMRRKGAKSTTEMELFHGTRQNPPKNVYESEEGFDMRFSRAGVWGLGNYFAVNASYASQFAYCSGHSYISKDKKVLDVLQIFLAKVLVGDSCNLPQDQRLRMPPLKVDGKVRYDSVNGYYQKLQVYITYSNEKAYPFYLISYTVG